MRIHPSFQTSSTMLRCPEERDRIMLPGQARRPISSAHCKTYQGGNLSTQRFAGRSLNPADAILLVTSISAREHCSHLLGAPGVARKWL